MKHELSQAVLQVAHMVNIEGSDTEFTAKVEILPIDRIDGDYKITFSLRRSHGEGELTDEAVLQILHEAQRLAQTALDEYNQHGGKQLTLNFSAPDAPKEGKKPKRAPVGEAASN